MRHDYTYVNVIIFLIPRMASYSFYEFRMKVWAGSLRMLLKIMFAKTANHYYCGDSFSLIFCFLFLMFVRNLLNKKAIQLFVADWQRFSMVFIWTSKWILTCLMHNSLLLQWMFFKRQFNYNSIFGHKRLCMIILRVFAPFQSKMWAFSSIWITFIVCISTLGIDKHLRAKTIEYWIWYCWIEIEWIKWVFNILCKFHYT